MSGNITPIFPNVIQSQAVEFTSADAGVAKAIYTPVGANGVRIDNINLAWDDTVANYFQLYLRRGGISYLLGTALLQGLAGSQAALVSAQPVNLLPYISMRSAGIPCFIQDPYGNQIINLDASSSLFGRVMATMTAAKKLHVVTFASEF